MGVFGGRYGVRTELDSWSLSVIGAHLVVSKIVHATQAANTKLTDGCTFEQIPVIEAKVGNLMLLGNIPVTTATKIFPKVLRYEWEAYCNTNGRGTDSISLS